jgi:hypothetical protein
MAALYLQKSNQAHFQILNKKLAFKHKGGFFTDNVAMLPKRNHCNPGHRIVSPVQMTASLQREYVEKLGLSNPYECRKTSGVGLNR